MTGWSVILFLAAFAGFLWPGYLLATALTRVDVLGRPARCALGFACSFAVFAVIGAPFLWFGYSFAGFLSVLYPLWALFAVLGVLAWYVTRHRQAVRGTAKPTPAKSSAPATLAAMMRSRSRSVLFAYLAVAAAAGCAWALGTWHDRQTVIFAAPMLLVAGCWIAWRFRRTFASLVRFDATDDEPAPKLWTVLAVVLIVAQAISAALGDRPDWDDCFYLAASADYQQAEHLNDQEPTYREGFPMPVAYRILCWELWGATLGHLSGVGPAVLFHSLLPGLLVLLAYGAYTGLLRQWLPRRWLPLALIGLSAAHLWGISSHWSATNYLLPRPWQSKAVLIHLALPLLMLLLLRFAERPSWRLGLSLVGCAVFALALSRSATFLVFVLVACLTPSLWRAAPSRRSGFVAGTALLLFLAGGAGLFLWAKVRPTAEGLLQPERASGWLMALHDYTRFGCVEAIWLLCLPLLSALIRDRRANACLVTFPIVFLATVGNPLLFDVVSGHLTTYDLYARLWWLLPIAPSLAVLFALVVRLLAHTWGRQQSAVFPLGLAAAGLALTFALPGLFVWGPANNFLGPLGRPHLADNPEKVPADLLPLSRTLAADPDIKHVRILCNHGVASFLTSISRDFRFVQTRARYLPLSVDGHGQPSDGLKRHILVWALATGRMPSRYSDYDLTDLYGLFGEHMTSARFGSLARNPTAIDAREWLTYFRVKYIILGPGDRGADLFERNGYRVIARFGAMDLWKDDTWGSWRRPTAEQPFIDDWVEPMRQVHARFKGTPGTLLGLGDSITMSRAFWSPLDDPLRPMPPSAVRDHILVYKYQRRECWRSWKGPEYGNETGRTVDWALAHIDAWLAKWAPETAVILLGTNDMVDANAADFARKMRRLVDRCLANGTVVILTTPPPRSGLLEKSTEFAAAVRQVARDARVPLIDYHAEILARRPRDWDGSQPPFTSQTENVYDTPTLISGDGRHPSNPRDYQDLSDESLRNNGYALRNYLTLTAYADVIRSVLRSGKGSP